MTDASVETDGRAARAGWQDAQGAPAARVAELEAENAGLRRALALAGLGAGRAAGPRRGGGPERGRAERAGDDAEARREREGAARPADAEQAAAGRAAVLEREERPRLVLDSAADYAILTTDLDRRVTSWNAGAERLIGWAEAEVLGRSADAIFTPEDRAAGAPGCEAAGALRDGRAADERWHLRKDGSRFWGSGLMMPLRDPAAGPEAPPLGLLKIMRDRTERRRAEEALRSRERRLRLLADTAAGLLAAADPDEVLGPTFRSLSEEFGVDISFSYVADAEEGGGLRLASCFGLPEESRPGFERLALGVAVCGSAARDRRPIHLADAQESDDPAAAALGALGVRAYVAFPLVAGDRLLGTLSFGSRGRVRFSEEELAFLGTVAQHVAVVRERLRAEDRLREVEARQTLLLRLGDALRPLRGAVEIQAEGCRLLGEHLRAAQVGFGRIDDAQERVTVHRDWSDGRVPSVVGTWRMDDFGPAFVAAMKRGETVAIPDIARDTRTNAPAVAAAYAGIGTRAVLDVPLVKGGRMAAMLFIHHPEPRPWSLAEVEAAEVTCARLWDAVERARAEAALRESEGRRRAALDAARLGTWEWDTAIGAAVLDDRARDIFGLAPGWGDRAEAVFDRIHPADRPRVLAESLAAAAARGRLDTEYRVLLPGGGERAVASLGDALPGAGDGHARMAGVFADITDRKRAEEARALLINELNHRVKNTLAVVQSLALQTARGCTDLPAFTAAFQARLIALARAHDLLTRESWEGAALADVVRAALEAGGEGRVDVDCGGCSGGTDAAPLLAPAQALALAMALHELATNALKHGALSVPGGRVSVRCRADPGSGARVVEWLERGGPPLAGPPARRGFGLRLLERGLAAQAGMEADLRFETRGVRCALRLPPVR